MRCQIPNVYGSLVDLVAAEQANYNEIKQEIDLKFDAECFIIATQKCYKNKNNTSQGSDLNAYRETHRNKDVVGHCDEIAASATMEFQDKCRSKWEILRRTPNASEKDMELCHQLLVTNMKDITITQCNEVEYITSNKFRAENQLFNRQVGMLWSNSSSYDFRGHTESENKKVFIWVSEKLNTVQDAMPMNLSLLDQIQQSVITTDRYMYAASQTIHGYSFCIPDLINIDGTFILYDKNSKKPAETTTKPSAMANDNAECKDDNDNDEQSHVGFGTRILTQQVTIIGKMQIHRGISANIW